jgi:hypothetical protein
MVVHFAGRGSSACETGAYKRHCGGYGRKQLPQRLLIKASEPRTSERYVHRAVCTSFQRRVSGSPCHAMVMLPPDASLAVRSLCFSPESQKR